MSTVLGESSLVCVYDYYTGCVDGPCLSGRITLIAIADVQGGKSASALRVHQQALGRGATSPPSSQTMTWL
jgi:hypothetical protein